MTTKEQTQSNKLRIPSREEFHRIPVSDISESDFCTQYPSGIQINKTANDLNWSRRTYKCRSIYQR